VTILVVFVAYALVLTVALAFAGFRSVATPSGGRTHRHSARILIVGATGGTGLQLVARALERGYAVTAMVRDPARLKIDHPRLKIVQGDVLDIASVEAAVGGQDAVVSALGHRRYFHPTRILSEGTRNILSAMERMGLYYTLFVIPVILPFYFWDKTRQERLIAASSVDWVIVRPGALTNRDSRGRYRSGRDVGSFLWTVRVSRGDVADFMLNQLTSDTHLRAAAGVSW
jgi:putative NADH-flavin reductase